jgi:D-methionine transport system substrate-binding protein
MLKKRFVLTAALLGFLSLGLHAQTLTVAASAIPHAEILEFVKPTLAREGVDLQIKVFDDYVQPNVQVSEKRIDVNYFQHQPYLDSYNKAHGTNLVGVTAVHIEPFGVYSHRYKKLAQVPNGASVAISNNPSNVGRALLLLASHGLITLKDPKNLLSTTHDIVTNPKNLKIRELDAAVLPRVLDQVDLAIINTNYALEAKLVPTRDALLLENGRSVYANLLVARPDNKNADAVKKLAAALNTPAVRKFIEQKYKGAITPAF